MADVGAEVAVVSEVDGVVAEELLAIVVELIAAGFWLLLPHPVIATALSKAAATSAWNPRPIHIRLAVRSVMQHPRSCHKRDLAGSTIYGRCCANS